ncbi:hypothetical protein [Pradoshia sp.]
MSKRKRRMDKMHKEDESPVDEAIQQKKPVIGYVAILLSIISLFLYPVIFGLMGFMAGVTALKRRIRLLGIPAVLIGLFSVLAGLFVYPFF